MEMYKWDPWWENDWPVSSLSRTRPNETMDASVAINETSSEYIIKAKVPAGFRKEEIDVTVNHGFLKILGGHAEENSPGTCGSFGVKPFCLSICRSFSLPEKIDAAGIRATMEDGLLKLEIPKANGVNDLKVKVVVH